MSTTTISTLRVELFPVPPPTNNSLDPEQRSRLLRSTRKLGELLGTTPFLLEPEVDDSTPSIPRVHASRREAQVFHSPSFSMDTSEPEYVLMKSGAKTSPNQYQSITPPSSRTPSPIPVRKTRKGGLSGAESVLPPIAIVFDIPGSTRARSRSVLSKKREQPLLLRLRPLPKQKAIDTRINVTTTMDPSTPLSPTASSINMDFSTTTLSDRDKRKKMAKLTRTLGENVPPELVFQSSAPRRASIPINRSHVDPLVTFQKPTKFVASTGAPPLAVAAAPKPSARTETQGAKSKHRPRNLSLGTASAITAANIALSRGSNSLDVEPTEVPKPKEAPFVAVQEVLTDLLPPSTEWGRRKEREWSGEWNIKDMDDVARKLRGLKRR